MPGWQGGLKSHPLGSLRIQWQGVQVSELPVAHLASWALLTGVDPVITLWEGK